MNEIIKDASFTVGITQQMHALAQKSVINFSSEDKDKKKQVYLNVLSVLSVDLILKTLGLKTESSKSEVFDSITQLFLDTAGINLSNYGVVECRWTFVDDLVFRVPADAWWERICYVFVQFNRELTEANIIGFLPSIKEEREEYLPEELGSFSEFLEFLESVKKH